MHFDTKKLTRCALIAAIYVALTMLSNALNLAYGPIQLRFSEARQAGASLSAACSPTF